MNGLTRRQAEALAFIRSFIATNGYSPEYREIEAAMGFHSKSGVCRLVDQLVERGVITRMPGRARSIALVGEAAW